MPSPEELVDIIQRVIDKIHTDEDLQRLQQLLGDGDFQKMQSIVDGALASGDRSVKIDRDATGAIITTGVGNTIINITLQADDLPIIKFEQKQEASLSHLWKRQKFLLAIGAGGLGIIGAPIIIQFLQEILKKTAIAKFKPNSIFIPKSDLPRKLFEYPKLEKLLKEKKWKAANEETQSLIFDPFLNNQNQPKHFDYFVKYVGEKISCDMLNEIDKLWDKYSDGKFGLSIQSKIYLECDFAADNNLSSYYDCFCERVGWRVNQEWIDYPDLIFNTSAPSGHLPYFSTPLEEYNKQSNLSVVTIISMLDFSKIVKLITTFNSTNEKPVKDVDKPSFKEYQYLRTYQKNNIYFPRVLMLRVIECEIKQ